MAGNKDKERGAPTGAPVSEWAEDPVPRKVREYLSDAGIHLEDRASRDLDDAFEVYRCTEPSNHKGPAEELESIEDAISASKKLRQSMGRLSEFTWGELAGSSVGVRSTSVEKWWATTARELAALEEALTIPAKKAETLKGSLSKKPTLEARDRLFRAVFQALSDRLDTARRLDVAADILEAAGAPVPGDTSSRRKILTKDK